MANKFALTVLRQKNSINTGSVFFFHGTGDTAPGILDWLKSLVGDFSLPHIKFVFPTAPVRQYTPFDGERTTVWFDRLDVSPTVAEHRETLDSASEDVAALIHSEVGNGISLNIIVVGGFSMGGCLALHTVYRFLPGLAGVFALSAYLNDDSAVYQKLQESSANAETPLFMCHGDRDDVVPFEWGQNTFNSLMDLNVPGQFMSLNNTEHDMKKHEIEKLLSWIVNLVPE